MVAARILGINRLDLACGALVTALGAFVAWEASGYPLGTPSTLGPGAFPVALGLLLAGLGGLILVEGMRTEGDFPAARLRPLVAVSAALLSFALLIENAGLVPATASLIVLSALAQRPAHLVSAAVTAGVLCVTGVVLFQYLLEIPLSAFAW